MTILIENGIIVNEGSAEKGHLVINNDIIQEIHIGESYPRGNYDKVVDATGCLVIPGVIDSHVHYREPGLTHKACIESESRAAAYGGVTSYFDMPNTSPQTTSVEALEDKFRIAKNDSHVNYSFFYGATNDNADTFAGLDKKRIPGIKLFMGSSTGNMLVDCTNALTEIFRISNDQSLPLMAHCEDTDIINGNMAAAKEKYGDDPDVSLHPYIRSREACLSSSEKAIAMAVSTGAKLHLAHLTTAEELSAIKDVPNVTGEATVAHLLFSDEDYKTLGTRIKCNPAVKTAADRQELRNALNGGTITTIGTDHAPHLLSEKEGGAAKAVSGMPMVQFSLVSMLSLVDAGILSAERMVELMCHAPASLFGVVKRGYLREGYKADVVIVGNDKPWVLKKEDIQSRCGWSPVEGKTFNWKVIHTFCNGHHVLDNGKFDNDYRGEEIEFMHK